VVLDWLTWTPMLRHHAMCVVLGHMRHMPVKPSVLCVLLAHILQVVAQPRVLRVTLASTLRRVLLCVRCARPVRLTMI
jgi:hypothetical protein